MSRRTLDKSLVSLAVISAISAANAAPGADSAYVTDPQNSYVEDATSRGIGQVNMITCIMSAMRPDALVNQGNYLALVDESKCDPESRSSAANGAGGAPAASYLTATVDSSRASNNDPMIAKAWITENQDGQSATIFVRISATQPPSANNPYGEFRMDFCGRADGFDDCMMNGFLEGTPTGVNYFEVEADSGNGESTKALRLSATGTTSGSGRMQIDSAHEDAAFAFAYNADLFRRNDGTSDQCFSRDATDPDTGMSVWRYGLYDAETGQRITRSSGFPIEYTADGVTHHGYLGYWGLNLPPEALATLTNGANVEKVDYSSGDSPTKTSYSVVKADGKLTKYTKKTRTLAELDKIKLTTFVGNDNASFFAGAEAFTQYELYWNEAGGNFTVTGKMSCGSNGCQPVNLETEQTVAVSYFSSKGGANGWSQALGGEVFIDLRNVSGAVDSANVPVVYRTQDLVYPSDLPETLYCVKDCPTADSLSQYFAPASGAQSPYEAATFNNWNPTPFANVVQYGTDPDSASLMDTNGAAVAFTDAEAMSARPQYQYGVRTGRLFENLADAECAPSSGTYCDWKVNDVEVYYQWETGSNSHNQFAAVKDGSGEFVQFDAPLQVTFNVPAGAAYGDYAGKGIVLQYGGFGDLWGIPGHCVSRQTNEPVSCEEDHSRYVPQFVIPYSQAQGVVTAEGKTYLVKWLDREIRFARKSLGTCDAAGLTAPAGVVLPTAADLRNPSDSSSQFYIGTKPTVTGAPRVIHGDVKY